MQKQTKNSQHIAIKNDPSIKYCKSFRRREKLENEIIAHDWDFLICQMYFHKSYGFLLLFAFVWTISYHNWFVYAELYYLQLFTIIAYHLNAPIMLLRYVICNYIWPMGSQKYELPSFLLHTTTCGEKFEVL